MLESEELSIRTPLTREEAALIAEFRATSNLVFRKWVKDLILREVRKALKGGGHE